MDKVFVQQHDTLNLFSDLEEFAADGTLYNL